MTPIVRPSSAFATLFWLWFGLAYHRMAWRTVDQRPFLPSGRFSAWFGRLSRGSQLRHNYGHRAAKLLWTGRTRDRFPGTQFCLNLWARQHQVVMHDSDNLTPALKLLWGAQSGLCPQQSLLFEAIAMFLPVAPPVAQSHLWHAGVGGPLPEKPTLARVAGLLCGLMTPDANDRHLDRSCVAQVQTVPPGNLNRLAIGIAAKPTARGLPIGAGISALKPVAIFARGSTFARRRRCGAVEHPFAFEAQQLIEGQPFGCQQERGTTGPAICRHDGTTAKQRGELTQLGRRHLDAGLLRADTLLIEHRCPTARFGWQDHPRRELPAIADRTAVLQQVRFVDHRSVCRGLRLRTLDTGGIYAQPHSFSLGWLHQILHHHPAQPVVVNAPILKRFIQTTPAPFKEGRERQLRKRVRLRLGQQGIHRIEQGVCRSLKTAVDLVTKALQCVKVHASNAPFLELQKHYSLGQSFANWTAHLPTLV